MDFTYRRGDICWFYDEKPFYGTFVKHGRRPAIIVSPDSENCSSSTVIIVPLTTKTEKKLYRSQFDIVFDGRRSRVCADQIRVVDKSSLQPPAGHISREVGERLDSILFYAMGLEQNRMSVGLAE